MPHIMKRETGRAIPETERPLRTGGAFSFSGGAYLMRLQGRPYSADDCSGGF